MKTAEELNALKEEVETLNRKLADLTDDELEQIVSGYTIHGPGRLYWGGKGKTNGTQNKTGDE